VYFVYFVVECLFLLPWILLMRSVTLATLLVLAGAAPAQTSYPMVTHAQPVVVQRGHSSQVVVEGQMNFQGVDCVLFQGTGVRAEVVSVPPPQARAVTLKVTVAADTTLGPREFRLISPLGVSSVGQLVICADPVVVARENISTPATAQLFPVPCVVSGRIKAAEEVALFRFHAEAGQTFTFEVLGARLQDKIHDLQKHLDPLLTLYDANGRELAANDDFFFADPLLTTTCRTTGDYLLSVRDSRYDGDPHWVYALFVTDRPAVSHVHPLCANPGQVVEVEPVGSARLVRERVKLTAPTTIGLHEVTLDINGQSTNPVAFLVSPLPQVQQQPGIGSPARAQRIPIPCGINGRLDRGRQLDHYVFSATKGRPVRFEVQARRFGTPLQSGLDSVLDVLGPKGEVLASNDDTFGKDALVVFMPPADGDYVLRLRDLNSKGGPTFVYHIEADWARPDFSLRCEGDKAMIGPGSRTAWYIHVTRSNGFTGPVQVAIKGLPAGMTVNPLTIPPTMTQGLLVLSAAPDARRVATNVEVVGTATVTFEGKQEVLTRVATPNEEINLPGGGRGRFDVVLHTVAITDPSDILDVEVAPAEIRLKPGQEVRLEVTVKRRADYDKGVTLDMLLRHLNSSYGNPLPPGVTLLDTRSQTLLGNGSKGYLVLRAAPDAAPIAGVPVCVLAQVSVNFVVKMSYASKPVLLTVEK
jgi:hypothetical protein